MSTPIELKVDRIEKMLIEVIEMVGRLESGLNAKIDAVDAKVEALRAEVKQMRDDQVVAHKEAMMRFITY
jgi:cell division protein FtsB